ncbi:MAG: homocysteine S-methyltransferase family protein [Candidatus Omnitrophica bacterium]|nr:homocysteine S-methyltransferase family protein [Candidatus Omnitrophota bacterium]
MERALTLRKTILLDGATGTYLARLGFQGMTPELACLSHPELVEKVYQDYATAGAWVILTNTFGANAFRLTKKGLADQLEKINTIASQLANQVKQRYNHLLIAGDIGPTGELIEPLGSLKADQARKCFRQQAEILAKCGVDFLLLETFSDLNEAVLAWEAIRDISSRAVVVSFSLSQGRDYRTMMGQSLSEIISWAEKAELPALGFNCGLGSSQMSELASQVKKMTKIPLWFKPNAGLPVLKEGKTVYPETPEEFAANCQRIVTSGASFIGGCCGTGPEHIAALAHLLA